MKIETGMMAPSFTLPDETKQKVSLEELRGKNVLLLFFPFAFTSTCTKELCSTRDDISFYNDADAEVFGISVDAPYSLKVFKQQQQLNFHLLSDFNKEASEAYGILYETFGPDLHGVSKRSAFVIDKAGIIRYAEVLENASALPDFDAIKKVLKEIA